jgi:hypothetical protein
LNVKREGGLYCRINIKRYGLNLLRWQLSTPILAPVVAYFKNSPSVFGVKEDWVGSIVANFIGGLIFFWVDMFIFTSQRLNVEWEVKDIVTCVDCGKEARGYRIIRAKGYDKTKGVAPEFRCEVCSMKKTEELRKRGIEV